MSQRRLHAAGKQVTRGMIADMRRTKGMLLLAAVLCALCGLNRAARAQTDLSPIVVIATRVAESSFDVPASVDRVSQEEIKNGQVQINISESLMTVPGVSAESRQNYAQDLQLSVRGFGARADIAANVPARDADVARERDHNVREVLTNSLARLDRVIDGRIDPGGFGHVVKPIVDRRI